MALLDARCTACGAALKINGGLDTAACRFCGAVSDVGKAVRYHYESVQAPPSWAYPGAPQSPQPWFNPSALPAPPPTNMAKAALFCGLASCAGALFSLAAGYASDAMYWAGGLAERLYGVVEVLAVLMGAAGVFLAIAGAVCSIIAGREYGLRKSGFVPAGAMCAGLGFLMSVIVIAVLLVAVF